MKFRKEIVDFTAVITQLLESGLSMNESLETAAEINHSAKGLNISAELYEKVKKGNTLSEAVNLMKDVFPETYRAFIALCDRTGHPTLIFPRLKGYIEKKEKNKNRLMGILLYPSIILLMTVATVFFLLLWIIPKFKEIFKDFGDKTEAIINANIQTFENDIILLLAAILCIIGIITSAFIFRKFDSRISETIDRMILQIPFIGNMVLYLELMNFCFAMETLSGSNLTVDVSLNETKNMLHNLHLKRQIEEIIRDINRGISMSQSFSKHKSFPKYISKWIHIGERTGNTCEVFMQLRIYFENELNKKTTILSSLAEPAVTLLTGITMMAMITKLIVPIMNLYGSIGL